MTTSVAELIKANKVVMFSWIHCPFCVRAKEILSQFEAKKQIKLDKVVYEVDTMSNGEDLRAQIKKAYNHETVPAIFINGQFIGGCSELQSLNAAGKMEPLLIS